MIIYMIWDLKYGVNISIFYLKWYNAGTQTCVYVIVCVCDRTTENMKNALQREILKNTKNQRLIVSVKRQDIFVYYIVSVTTIILMLYQESSHRQ